MNARQDQFNGGNAALDNSPQTTINNPVDTFRHRLIRHTSFSGTPAPESLFNLCNIIFDRLLLR